MGRLVKANPAVETSKNQTTVVGTGAHGRLVRTGDVQRTSPAGNAAQQPTIYQKALDAAMERANEKDKLTTPSADAGSALPAERGSKHKSGKEISQSIVRNEDAAKRIGAAASGTAQNLGANASGFFAALLAAAEKADKEYRDAKEKAGVTTHADEMNPYPRTNEEITRRNRAGIDLLEEIADTQRAKAAQNIKTAKEGLGTAGKAGIDAFQIGVNLAGIVGANMIAPGLGTAALAISSGGSMANDYRQSQGENYNPLAAAGLAIGGAASVGVGGAAARGAAKYGGALLNKLGLGSSVIAQNVLGTLSDIAFAGGMSATNEYAKAAAYGDSYQKVAISGEQLAKDMLFQAAVGFFCRTFTSSLGGKADAAAAQKVQREYFKGIDNLDDLTKAFKQYGKQYHPDRFATADAATQQKMNDLFARISAEYNAVKAELAVETAGRAAKAYSEQRSAKTAEAAQKAQATVKNEIAVMKSLVESGSIQAREAIEAVQILDAVAGEQSANGQGQPGAAAVQQQPAAAPENAPQQVTGKLESTAVPAAAAQEGVPQQVSSTESIPAAEADNNMIGVENNAGPQTQYEPGGAEPAEAGEGSILSGGDGGRDAGARAGEQAGVVESSGSQRAPERSRTAIERQNLARDLRLEKVSSAELGIRQGTDAKSVTVLPENIWDAELQETAQRIRRETGKKTTMVLGTIPIATRDGVTRVRGVWASDGIIIQADNLRVSPGQIASHEIFHEFADQNPGLIQAVERSIREKYGDQEFDRIVESYIQNLRGIIDIDENAAEYEVEQALLDVKNEILADAYADINAFGQNAGKYREEVRQTLGERGITDSGSETAAATERRTGPPERYSLNEFEDGKRFVDVQTDQAQFDGLNDKQKTKLAIQIIKERFSGKVIGIDNRVFVNGRSAAEYGYPIKNISSDIRDAKMRASTELDNLIDAGTNFRTAPDGKDGHIHPNAAGDFRYFDTTFKVGNEYYKGVVNILPVSKGLLLKDITKIENITQDISSSYGQSPKSTFLRDASMSSIPRSGGNVKPKQRFSMEEPVEETKTLIAMHNMTEEKLRRTLDLGAWPSPSIAIVKAKDGHSNYGEYSAIFPRETIDPQADSRNHVYGGDAWTPTHDNALVEREVNYAARRAFDSRIGDLSSQFAGGIFRGNSTLGKIGLENETRWEPGEIAEKLANYPEVQAAYLQSKGESLEPERRSKRFDRNYSNETIQRYLDSVGAQEVARLNVKLLTGGHLTEKEAAQAEKAIREVYSEEHANFLNRRPESKEKRIDYYMQNNVTRNRVEDFVRSAEAFYESGGSANELDKEATAAKMFEMIAPGGSWGDALRVVKDWVQPQLDGLLGERGVYNGKDTVTDRGRRSFAETHWDYTAENIVKAMNMASDKGANMYGVTPETLTATATPEFRSVDEMHAGEDRLRTEDQDAHDRALRDLGVELDRVVDDLMRTTKHRHSNTFDEEQALSGIIAEAAKGKRTASAVKAAFRKEGYTVSDGHAASILHLIERAASIPTGYYEAKPQRVVPFTESVAVVAPDNAPADLLSEMREAGMNVIEYAAGDDADRLEKINSIKDIRFSAEDAAADEALQRSKEESAEDMRRAREEADEALANRAAEQYRKEKWAENRAERAYIKAERDAKREDAGNVTPVRKATKPVAESKPIDAKNSLRRKMTKLFRIPEGAQKEAGKIIDACADHILKNGALTQDERTRFLNRMYESGIVNTDSLMRAAGQYVAPRRIYVDKKTKAAFGDEWNSFRRRAHAAGLNLLTTEKTKDTSVGIDALGAQLAEQLPTVFSPGKFSEQELLEHVVQLAEEGQTEHMSLSDYIAEVSGKDFIRERQLYNELEREMDHALQTFAETAKIEIKLRDRTGIKLAQEREEFHRQQQEDRARRRERESAEKAKKQAENEEREQRARERAILRQAREQEYRIEAARRKRENRELRELQQKTLKQLQWLSKNRERAPEEVKEAWDDVLGDIDIYAASAANELHWSEKHKATWGDLRDIYLKAKDEDPNFLPSEELEKIVARLDKDKIADMDLDALRDLYEAAVGLRTEFYNRNKVLGDEEFREFNEIYLNATQEIKDAPKGKKRGGKAGKLFDAMINDQQLSPMNVMQRMGGWNPDGSFYSMAKQLEQGERAARDYTVKANRLLEDFLNKHQDWVKKADGQGKDAIWYKLEVPELTKLEMGDKPIFGDTVTVYMTPAQKVHLYLESKNYSNLRHMTGGRKFVDRELYSRGERDEALDKGTTVKLAPETVKKLVSDLTPEEAELARILEQYYNTFAPKEINRVSNVLLGYDKANTKNYAPIYTDQNYTKSKFGVFDVTAEGVGNLKKRKVSTTPSLNISAFDAFEKHVDQTARYTGMAIPTRNMNSLMNWCGESGSMEDVIAREWGGKANQYIRNLVTEMQGEKSEEKTAPDIISERTFSNYISAVFGFNPSIVLKQLGSIPMGSAYLGMENLPSVKQIRGIDEKLISRYTQELAWRTMGYSMPETKQLKDNPNWTETNKFVNFTFGGGAITAMDGWAASVLWPQAENKVRREHPELEIGTDEQVKNGTSPFYQAVAKEFNDAVARSQSTSDIIHQGTLRRSKNPITRAFTMFKSDSSQTYNAIRQKYGEWQYYKKSGASEETLKKAKKGLGEAVLAALVNAVWSETVTFAMAALKNGAKRYRDDDDELTAASILKEFGTGLVGDLAGVMVGGEELAEFFGNAITGEKWYRIETPGLEQLDDLLENTKEKLSSLWEHGGEFLNIMENGGSLSEYMRREGNNLVGWIRDVAKDVATYIPGVPVNNIETYLLGVVRSISPEAAAAYEDAFTRVEKNDLKHTHGRTLKAKTRDLLKDRTGSDRKETADAVAELYDSGYTKALPSATPSSVTIDKVEHKLNAYQTQVYEMAWRKAISGELDEMVQLPVFRRASEEMREKMLDKLYSYASDMAKAAVFDDYEPKTSTQTMSENAKHGLTVAVQIVGEVGKESDPKGLSLPTLGD